MGLQVGTMVCEGRVIIPVRAIVITIFKLNFCLIYLEKYDVNVGGGEDDNNG